MRGQVGVADSILDDLVVRNFASGDGDGQKRGRMEGKRMSLVWDAIVRCLWGMGLCSGFILEGFHS